jgi:hypothetical protein
MKRRHEEQEKLLTGLMKNVKRYSRTQRILTGILVDLNDFNSQVLTEPENDNGDFSTPQPPEAA